MYNMVFIVIICYSIMIFCFTAMITFIGGDYKTGLTCTIIVMILIIIFVLFYKKRGDDKK